MPGHLFEGNPVDEDTKRRVTDTPVHRLEKPADSTHSLTRGLKPPEQLERQVEFHSSDKTWPDSPVPTLQGHYDRSQNWRGSLRFLPPLKTRPFSIAAKPVESREARPKSTVCLSSQRHPEKLPKVTGRSRRNPGFPAATRERPRESCFNVS